MPPSARGAAYAANSEGWGLLRLGPHKHVPTGKQLLNHGLLVGGATAPHPPKKELTDEVNNKHGRTSKNINCVQRYGTQSIAKL